MPDESQDKMVRTSVVLPPEKKNLLRKIAGANGASVAWVIRYAIEEFIENNQNNKKLKLKMIKE